jgi:outer membrane receptor protein involved in Fe transport
MQGCGPWVRGCVWGVLVATGVQRQVAHADDLSPPPMHDIEELSLDDLLSSNVEVTAQRPQNIRESVGVITVITHDEIVRTGARDLSDVLMRVPGFQMGLDILNVVDVGFRGMWGHEGKVLLLIDGMQMNEVLYGTNQFGNHYPVDQIERIEIIRGPGSVIYGGTAELAVINVITRKAETIGTATIMGMYGQTLGGGDFPHADGFERSGFERRDVSILLGHVFDKKRHLAVTLGAFLGQSSRTNKDYTDLYGAQANLDNAERGNPHFVNFGLTFEKLDFRFIYDFFHGDTQAGYDALYTQPTQKDFKSLITGATYDIAVSKTVTLTPWAQYAYEHPWNSPAKSLDTHSDTTEQRFLGGLNVSWNALEKLNLLAGVSGYHDHGHDNDTATMYFGLDANGNVRENVYYNDYAAFAQVLFESVIGHLAVGARYEAVSGSSQTCPDGTKGCSTDASSFVPRAALTKTIDKLHFKLLAAQAFRSPISGDYGLQQTMPPITLEAEKTTTYELEVGYKISDILFGAMNVFDTTIRKPIVYDNLLGYKNFPKTGARGVEATLRLQHARGWGEATFSYYNSSGKNEVDEIIVPGHDAKLLAFATSKATLVGNVDVASHISASATVIYLSKRFGYGHSDADGNPLIDEYGPTALVHVFAMYHDLGKKNLDLGLGLYNLLDDRYEMIQAYNSSHAPVPTAGREVLLRLSYQVR